MILAKTGADDVLLLTFSEDVRQETVVSAFSLSPATLGSWLRVRPAVFAFMPQSRWVMSQPYTLRIAATVEDLAGNKLAFPYEASFTPNIPVQTVQAIKAVYSSSEDEWTVFNRLDAKSVAVDVDGNLRLVIRFSQPYPPENGAKLASALLLDAYFPSSLGDPSLVTALWTGGTTLSLTYAGLEKSTAECGKFYKLTLPGGFGFIGQWVRLIPEGRCMAVFHHKPMRLRSPARSWRPCLCTGLLGCSLFLGLDALRVTDWRPHEARLDAASVDEIWAEFSAEVDEARAEQAFSLSENGSSIPGSFTWSGKRTSIRSCASCWRGNDYEIAVLSSAETRDGNSLAKDFRFAFSTKEEKRATHHCPLQPSDRPPMVSIPRAPVVINFSEPVDHASLWLPSNLT